MRTIVSKGPEAALELVEAQPVTAGAGEVVIDVRAAGVGRVDQIMRQMSPAPFVPGIEVAGIVTEVAPDVDPAWRGRRVFARVPNGAYADQAVASGAKLVALPDGVAFEAAVASGTNALVAYVSLARSKAASGERVVVRGARGGIGHLAVQMARRLGADVVEAARDGVPPAADVVVDLVAGPDTGAYLEKLNPNGRYVLAGIAAGMPSPDFANALLADFRRSRSVATLSLDTVADADLNRAAEEIFDHVDAGRIVPEVAATLPLHDADRAHHLLAKGGMTGKVVLVP